MTAFLIILAMIGLAFIIPSNYDPAIKLKEYAEQKAKDQVNDAS